MDPRLTNPQAMAELGEKIYAEKYRDRYELTHPGYFLVIDVQTGAAYLGATPEAAYEAAHAVAPNGLFHLVRIGQPGAYRVSYTSNDDRDWIFQ